jgi:mono/diheme cytochrome c family protein
MSLRQPLRAVALALTAGALLGASLSLAAPATTAKPAATTPAKGAPAKAAAAGGDAAAGKAIFKVKCVACHKVDGTGGFKVTGNPTPNWTLKKTWDATRTDAYLRDCITNGKLKSGMVAWGKTNQLKPAEIDNMIAYIKTFKAAAK